MRPAAVATPPRGVLPHAVQANVATPVQQSPEFLRLLTTLVLRAVTSKTSLAPNVKRSEPVPPARVHGRRETAKAWFCCGALCAPADVLTRICPHAGFPRFQTLAPEIEQEERRLVALYMPVLKRFEEWAPDHASRWRLQTGVLDALQDMWASSDSPVCTSCVRRASGGGEVGHIELRGSLTSDGGDIGR